MHDQPRRILVYGVTGSGKTTLAARISERTGIPWTSVDDLTFEPGWVQVADEIQRERFAEICSRDAWILDTAYAKWLDIPLARAQVIVGLDYPRWLSFRRLLGRTIMRLFDKRPICNGNRETLRNFFSRDSILLWHFKSFRRKQARIHGWITTREVVHLKHPREAEEWLTQLS